MNVRTVLGAVREKLVGDFGGEDVARFRCYPWPNTYLSRLLYVGVAITLASAGLVRGTHGSIEDGVFLFAIAVALAVLAWRLHDELDLSSSSIIRPSGRATRRIPFGDVMSIDTGERGHITVSFRQRQLRGGDKILRERARLLDSDAFVAEAFARIEMQCGSEFTSALRAHSSG